jgi:hypothetical protein
MAEALLMGDLNSPQSGALAKPTTFIVGLPPAKEPRSCSHSANTNAPHKNDNKKSHPMIDQLPPAALVSFMPPVVAPAEGEKQCGGRETGRSSPLTPHGRLGEEEGFRPLKAMAANTCGFLEPHSSSSSSSSDSSCEAQGVIDPAQSMRINLAELSGDEQSGE